MVASRRPLDTQAGNLASEPETTRAENEYALSPERLVFEFCSRLTIQSVNVSRKYTRYFRPYVSPLDTVTKISSQPPLIQRWLLPKMASVDFQVHWLLSRSES